MAGPLEGFRIIEFVGIGPGPFAGMMLADMGAEVIAIDPVKPRGLNFDAVDLARRGKRSLAVDLKSPDGVGLIKELITRSDALIEGFRPGSMEKLGLGPDDIFPVNKKLVYGRLTGWGQEGPMAKEAGHDINYLAITGALHAIGHRDRPPVPPLSLVGDYAGGSLMMISGLLAALLSAAKTGEGQVVDAAIIDGASLMMTMFWSLDEPGIWQREREANLLDGGAHFYGCYECSDGEYMAIGPIEPQFAAEFAKLAGLPADWPARALDRNNWQANRQELEALFKSKTQAEWAAIFSGSDACATPVLPYWQSPDHPHMQARNAFLHRDGRLQPAPSPRFSATPADINGPPVKIGADTEAIMQELGLDYAALKEKAVVK